MAKLGEGLFLQKMRNEVTVTKLASDRKSNVAGNQWKRQKISKNGGRMKKCRSHQTADWKAKSGPVIVAPEVVESMRHICGGVAVGKESHPKTQNIILFDSLYFKPVYGKFAVEEGSFESPHADSQDGPNQDSVQSERQPM